MKNPFKRSDYTYRYERERLLNWLNDSPPESPEYKEVMARLDSLDRMHKRSFELTTTVIPALATVGAVGGIYALQQFAGVIVPKVVDSITARSTQKKHHEN